MINQVYEFEKNGGVGIKFSISEDFRDFDYKITKEPFITITTSEGVKRRFINKSEFLSLVDYLNKVKDYLEE